MTHSWFLSGYRKGTLLRTSLRRRLVSTLLLASAVLLPRLAVAQENTAPKELRIFAAADLVPVMPALAQIYEKKTGVHLKVTTGASGTLVTQIENGAPADLFLGADFAFPEKLVAANLTDSKSPTAYAIGTLVLFALKNSPMQPLQLDRLNDPRAQKIAIADPNHAPFGRAAMAALTQMKFIDSVKPRLVTAENVSQAGQFVVSGNAQLGLVSLTLADSQQYKEIGTYVLIPESQYPEIRQCAVILAKGNQAAAHAFLSWLLSPEIQSKLPNVGLRPAQ